MTERRTPPGFAARPADPERWVRAPEKPATPNRFTARLTIDVTPALRARLKVAAFQRGITVADMLRVLLAREFPDTSGDVP
ncbi:hypothetical protein AA103196_1084 [Ameyamaea chiangmaiensis NBRC 103196]|uniref:Plasmid segregation centromere-binding protein ParG n=3 Tax=Acetobacteraceae TaxID=433 RepID=A0A850PBX1_9PROT|nr:MULTISPECIES: hypothetical protein [Acetobacteraceae]MBB2161165.1 hypothetical protein [Gluconacetobacter sacchari]MBS4076325.1 hypothetical protein [Ameyamaea chiangmaiensis]NVN39442.1 hypothetical protein [Ameyamaea chiangmaiensis]GBQ25574.1 hypothetical protein AA12717_2096 [Gluconacetobacter sacchari DSM 12717]GBQ65237.1 hypothetical protein AA103196_1084 [Ameyamaea chiangmaiensis NBRC 103196]